MTISSSFAKSFGSSLFGASSVFCPPSKPSKPSKPAVPSKPTTPSKPSKPTAPYCPPVSTKPTSPSKPGVNIGVDINIGGIGGGWGGVGGGWGQNSNYAFQVGDGKDFLAGQGQGSYEFGFQNNHASIIGGGNGSGFQVGINGKGVSGYASGTGAFNSFQAGVGGLMGMGASALSSSKNLASFYC